MVGVSNKMFRSEAWLAEPFSAGTPDVSRTLLTFGAFYLIIHDDNTRLVDQGVSR